MPDMKNWGQLWIESADGTADRLEEFGTVLMKAEETFEQYRSARDTQPRYYWDQYRGRYEIYYSPHWQPIPVPQGPDWHGQLEQMQESIQQAIMIPPHIFEPAPAPVVSDPGPPVDPLGRRILVK
jgi:hypothetical protein